METEILKKKISTYRGPGGRVRITSDDLLMDILLAWENWTGPMKGFYKSIGVSQKGFASIIGKAKKLKREGHFPEPEFKEVKIAEDVSPSGVGKTCSGSGITVKWGSACIIKFSLVDQLVDFLDKTKPSEKEAA